MRRRASASGIAQAVLDATLDGDVDEDAVDHQDPVEPARLHVLDDPHHLVADGEHAVIGLPAIAIAGLGAKVGLAKVFGYIATREAIRHGASATLVAVIGVAALLAVGAISMAFRMWGMRSLSVDVRAGLRTEQRLAGLRWLAWAGLFLALCRLFAVVMVALAWRASPERSVLQ